ncbi:hypothetical protein TNCV_2424161 [Trichonephila clavipes]|nr:hypothetical protein TNCV_2424161 [Trichonephila clavipes]
MLHRLKRRAPPAGIAATCSAKQRKAKLTKRLTSVPMLQTFIWQQTAKPRNNTDISGIEVSYCAGRIGRTDSHSILVLGTYVGRWSSENP